LRNYALGSNTAFVTPLGIDLFIKKGTLSWIAALSEYRKNILDYSATTKAATDADKPLIPQALQPEITMVLANMIMSYGGRI
jgi:hypothetical protein